VDVWSERATEQHHAEDHERDELDAGDAARDERGGAPGADELDLRRGGIHARVIRAVLPRSFSGRLLLFELF
jgi:hypothetical protein